jgi:hypothetical protein
MAELLIRDHESDLLPSVNPRGLSHDDESIYSRERPCSCESLESYSNVQSRVSYF